MVTLASGSRSLGGAVGVLGLFPSGLHCCTAVPLAHRLDVQPDRRTGVSGWRCAPGAHSLSVLVRLPVLAVLVALRAGLPQAP